MLAKNQKQRPARISVRYYLWSAEGPQRITQRLHRELFERDVAMPQFAGTKQKVLEVFVQRVTKMHYSISARGVVYPFDADGFLDVKTLALEGSLKSVGSDRHKQTFLTLTLRLSDAVSRSSTLGNLARRCWMMFGATLNPVVPGVVGCLCYGHLVRAGPLGKSSITGTRETCLRMGMSVGSSRSPPRAYPIPEDGAACPTAASA